MKNRLKKEQCSKKADEKVQEYLEAHQTCLHCNSRLVSSHMSDYRKLFIYEKRKCMSCESVDEKKLHYIN